MKFFKTIITVLCIFTSTTTFATTIGFLNNDPNTGQIENLYGVDVNGVLYDVNLNFAWSNSGRQTYSFDFAKDASIALYNLIHTPNWTPNWLHYNQNPATAWGCSASDCLWFTTYFDGNPNSALGQASTKRGFAYHNLSFTSADWSNIHFSNYTPDNASNVTFLQWTPSPVVPVPAAVWLFGSGLIGLIGVARRKKV